MNKPQANLLTGCPRMGWLSHRGDPGDNFFPIALGQGSQSPGSPVLEKKLVYSLSKRLALLYPDGKGDYEGKGGKARLRGRRAMESKHLKSIAS